MSKIDRSCNVLLHNIPESESEEPEVRKEFDAMKVKDIARALYGENAQCDIQNAFRLGKKSVADGNIVSRKPRLLLVKLESKEQVEKLLKERFSLKDKGYPNIYITRDLPLEEREKQRKLRAELQQKGRDTHKIVRGKVVPKN